VFIGFRGFPVTFVLRIALYELRIQVDLTIASTWKIGRIELLSDTHLDLLTLFIKASSARSVFGTRKLRIGNELLPRLNAVKMGKLALRGLK
jgi:hypothetical protein